MISSLSPFNNTSYTIDMSLYSDVPILDLFDPDKPLVRKQRPLVAHAPSAESKETTTVVATQDKQKKVEKAELDDYENEGEEHDDGIRLDLMEFIKYALIAVGGGYLLYELFSHHSGNNSKKDVHSDILMSLMVMMYQSHMKMMNGGNNNNNGHEKYHSKEGGEHREENEKDEMPEWLGDGDDGEGKHRRHRHRHRKGGMDDDEYSLNELGVTENWRVRKDLDGNVLSANKTSGYLR